MVEARTVNVKKTTTDFSLYNNCRFLKKNLNTSSRPPEHPGGIICIGYKDKRAPMKLRVTLGQQYHVEAYFYVAQFIF